MIVVIGTFVLCVVVVDFDFIVIEDSFLYECFYHQCRILLYRLSYEAFNIRLGDWQLVVAFLRNKPRPKLVALALQLLKALLCGCRYDAFLNGVHQITDLLVNRFHTFPQLLGDNVLSVSFGKNGHNIIGKLMLKLSLLFCALAVFAWCNPHMCFEAFREIGGTGKAAKHTDFRNTFFAGQQQLSRDFKAPLGNMRVKGFPGRLLEQRIEVIDTSYICFVNMLKIFGFGKLVDNRGRDDAFKLILGCGSFQATVVMLSAKALIISLTHEVRRITTKEVKSHDFASFVKCGSFFYPPPCVCGICAL